MGSLLVMGRTHSLCTDQSYRKASMIIQACLLWKCCALNSVRCMSYHLKGIWTLTEIFANTFLIGPTFKFCNLIMQLLIQLIHVAEIQFEWYTLPNPCNNIDNWQLCTYLKKVSNDHVYILVFFFSSWANKAQVLSTCSWSCLNRLLLSGKQCIGCCSKLWWSL